MISASSSIFEMGWMMVMCISRNSIGQPVPG
jgi:hypothetical protein